MDMGRLLYSLSVGGMWSSRYNTPASVSLVYPMDAASCIKCGDEEKAQLNLDCFYGGTALVLESAEFCDGLTHTDDSIVIAGMYDRPVPIAVGEELCRALNTTNNICDFPKNISESASATLIGLGYEPYHFDQMPTEVDSPNKNWESLKKTRETVVGWSARKLTDWAEQVERLGGWDEKNQHWNRDAKLDYQTAISDFMMTTGHAFKEFPENPDVQKMYQALPWQNMLKEAQSRMFDEDGYGDFLSDLHKTLGSHQVTYAILDVPDLEDYELPDFELGA